MSTQPRSVNVTPHIPLAMNTGFEVIREKKRTTKKRKLAAKEKTIRRATVARKPKTTAKGKVTAKNTAPGNIIPLVLPVEEKESAQPALVEALAEAPIIEKSIVEAPILVALDRKPAPAALPVLEAETEPLIHIQSEPAEPLAQIDDNIFFDESGPGVSFVSTQPEIPAVAEPPAGTTAELVALSPVVGHESIHAAIQRKSFLNVLAAAWNWLQQKLKSQQVRKRLRVCESVSLGEKRFVALIQVDGEQFLVGGSSTSISTLAHLERRKEFADVLCGQGEQGLSRA